MDPAAPARDYLRRLPWDLSRAGLLDFERQFIASMASTDSTFPSELRQVALSALRSADPKMICRGLVGIALVGTQRDIPHVYALTTHNDSGVSSEAQRCLHDLQANNCDNQPS